MSESDPELQKPQKVKKPKQALPVDSTDLVPQTVKIGALTVEVTPQGLERFLVDNDASQLAQNASTRSLYYLGMCQRYGVDPYTQPFDWIPGADGKGLTLYPNKEFAAQLRKKQEISCRVVEEGVRGPANGQPGPEVYFVRMQGETKDGRVDEEIGVVPFTDAMGRPIDPMSKANAMKRAYTQAKRRVTLSLVGCGTDEPTREYSQDREQGPSQPRVLVPPTRVKALPPVQAPQAAQEAPEQPRAASVVPGAAKASESPSQSVVDAVSTTVQQPEPQKPSQGVAPQPQSFTHPGPPAAPAQAPQVTIVGTRKIFIPRR